MSEDPGRDEETTSPDNGQKGKFFHEEQIYAYFGSKKKKNVFF